MSKQMVIRLDSMTKTKLYELARAEGKTISKVMRELIQNYIKERDMTGYIDDLWARMGSKLKARGVRIAEIESAIKKARDSKNESGD